MKVTIIGTAPGWVNAPECDGNTWGVCHLLLRRHVDLVIDMNDYRLWGKYEAEETEWTITYAQERGIPYIDLGNYPLSAITEHFGVDYFSNTVDYAMALAIYNGATEIHIWGVDMAQGSEYSFEIPGMNFWCGVAIGRGVKVTIHGEKSAIMRTRDDLLYGYGTQQITGNERSYQWQAQKEMMKAR
jgi:hypothetical protein